MGDGRYYTPEQFFNVMLLTSLIISMVISFMLCLYKVDRYKNWILTGSGLLGVSLVGSFIAEVAYTENNINIFNTLSSLSLIIYIIIFLIFYIRYFTKYDKERKSIATLLFMFCIATAIYIIDSDFKNLLYVLFVINFVILSNRFVTYRVSSSVFSDVKKLMFDYVFIIGVNGDVIFKNDKIINSTLFNESVKINAENIENIFCDKVVTRNVFGKKFIKVSGKEIFYFHHNRKEIYDKEKIAGYILTFIDITELIAMLDELSRKQVETSKINTELNKHKEIVYDIEREKEINTLLEEITGTQQKAILMLKNKIKKLNLNDKDFIPEIEKLIFTAQSDLSDVREVVTAYINYYEEGGYDD